jgi:hypothetical protein
MLQQTKFINLKLMERPAPHMQDTELHKTS